MCIRDRYQRRVHGHSVKKNSIQIIIIALFQLLVFVTPQVIKSTHHHHAEKHFAVTTEGKTITPSQEKCPLCHFEFVTFIKADKEKQSVFKKLLYTVSTGKTLGIIQISFHYFANRAPPLFTVQTMQRAILYTIIPFQIIQQSIGLTSVQVRAHWFILSSLN
eukprot:TRINITY_DN23038_c0_g1_i1.p1 TRINITY_DN23038_c0_g1~~TRINITY_DN23038_c0_g1_i1.p1  ORF type:complete len:162 (+),score=5.77 TRINITY_DN23038_c0_g1_i1:184-669(+)